MLLCCESNRTRAFWPSCWLKYLFTLSLAVGCVQADGLTNISQPSGLLPPGTTSFSLHFTSAQAATCRYSLGSAANMAFNSMSPIESAPVTEHVAAVSGLNPDPGTLNTVNIACDSNPADITTLTYRAVTAPNGNYPRIGSIWIGNYIYSKNLAAAKKIQLFLGAGLSPAQTATLRSANSNVIVLPSTNVVEAVGYPNGVIYGSITLPDGTVTAPITVPDASYYLYDVHGNPISDWPGSYLLNLTKPTVAQFLGNAAYQVLANSNFAYDGIFFDNFYTSISWFTTDVNGNPVQISSANNGVADDPTSLDAAWGVGAYSELATFRSLAPSAYTAGHLGLNPPAGATLNIYNGDSLVFGAVNVREGTMQFGNLWNDYQTWTTQSQTPPLSMIQSSPPNQIAYGYGYTPIPYSGASVIPAATSAFGQTFYPNMRFGLATALMNNGFFTHDFGDTGAPVNWWYDEYDFNLGTPQRAAQNISGVSSVAQLTNGGFENGLTGWNLSIDSVGGDTVAANVTTDSTTAAQGSASAHIAVTSPTTIDWHIDFNQQAVSLTAGTNYQLSFWAKASASRMIGVALQAGAPGYAEYYSNQVVIDSTWRQYTFSFNAGKTDPATSLEFFLGGPVGDIWLDGVQFGSVPPNIYRRDFTNGTVLLNGTNTAQTINLGSGFQRFTGTQAPLYQYIIDDTDSGFSSTGTWSAVTIDTGYGRTGAGETPNGPYYHAWNATAQLNSGSGTAQWNLHLPGDGTYTIQAWLPAAPSAGTWSKNAVYEVVSGTTVLATGTIDQTNAASGDQWHTIATVTLTAASAPFVRLHSGDGASILADALYLTSASRFNDGTAATSVTLQPFDGILLQRQTSSGVLTPQTITFNAIASQAVGTSLTLTASASSGLPVSYSSSTTNVCTVSGTTASLIASGSCTITASQAGNATYAAAPSVSQAFAVLAALTPQTISFPTIGQQVNGATLTLNATATSGLPVTYATSTANVCSVAGATLSIVNGGTCTITASQAGNSIYAAATPVTQSFTVLGIQSISFPAISQQVAGSTLLLGASATSGLPISYSSSTTNVCTVSGSSLSLIAAGGCTVTASQSGNALYAAAASVSQTFTVTATSSPSALQFVPVTPCRIADTRLANGAYGGPELAAATQRDFLIPGSTCGIPSNAAAYSLNVTAVPTGGLGFLAIFPSGSTRPLVSTLNSDSRVKANAAIVPAGNNGGVTVYVSDASHVILDINGYFVSGNSSALAFYPVTPCRISDTRLANGPLGGPYLAATVTRTIPVQSSSCGLPSTAQAYSLNFTAIPHSWLGYLSTWPAGQSQPVVSTLNSGGAITANAAIVPAGAGGAINVYASNDSDLAIDVDGYFAPASTGGLSLYTVTPCRVLDTRTSSGAFNGIINVLISSTTCLSASTAQAFVLNATVVPPSGLSYITLWPNGQTQPVVSTLNANDGAITSNMAIVPTVNGSISVFSTNPTQSILDISAYFAP